MTAFEMAVDLDKTISDALSVHPETVDELEKQKRLVKEWNRKEIELQKYLDEKGIEVVSYGHVYMRGRSK